MYRRWVRTLYIPDGALSGHRVALPCLRRLSIPHLSFLNKLTDLLACTYLTLRGRDTRFEEIPFGITLPSITHIILPPRRDMRGITLTREAVPNLKHIAIPIHTGNRARALLLSDQRPFLQLISDRFNLETMVLIPWNKSGGRVVTSPVIREQLMSELRLGTGDTRHVISSSGIEVACGESWRYGEWKIWHCAI